MNNLPVTAANLKICSQNFNEQFLNGEVSAGGFEWEFKWSFMNGELIVEPSLGRALIQDALLRFLIKSDYKLEPGENYIFTVRAKF
tara:strand:+ start:38 stop:295 length:258 start_codon:yes stop_codon:yes gene_type:complete